MQTTEATGAEELGTTHRWLQWVEERIGDAARCAERCASGELLPHHAEWMASFALDDAAFWADHARRFGAHYGYR